jgi:hypothetical protein
MSHFGVLVVEAVIDLLAERHPGVLDPRPAVQSTQTLASATFRPGRSDAVELGLVVFADGTFHISAASFVVLEPDGVGSTNVGQTVEEIVDVLDEFASRGLIKVRSIGIFGPFSPTFIAAPGKDDLSDNGAERPWSYVSQRWQPWS